MPIKTLVKEIIGKEELGPLNSVLVAGSNFGLAMNASHYFEAFRFLCESPVDSIQAWLEPIPIDNPRGKEFTDHSGRLLARSKSDKTMYIDFSGANGWGLQVIYICQHGQILVNELSGEMQISARKPEFRDLPTTRYGMPVNVRQITIEQTDLTTPTVSLWRALLDGLSFPDSAVGVHALECLVAAHLSHESDGCKVRLDDLSLAHQRVFTWA